MQHQQQEPRAGTWDGGRTHCLDQETKTPVRGRERSERSSGSAAGRRFGGREDFDPENDDEDDERQGEQEEEGEQRRQEVDPGLMATPGAGGEAWHVRAFLITSQSGEETDMREGDRGWQAPEKRNDLSFRSLSCAEMILAASIALLAHRERTPS